MIPELPAVPMPEWLRTASDPLGRSPLVELLACSVYYPACWFDGRPVKYLAGNYYSFIYVDYGVDRDEVARQLTMFRGYSPLAVRDVGPQELAPQGWSPLLPRPGDGDPRRSQCRIRPPFALWSILERTPDYGPEHGPERFSLLYIGGDGVATFQAIYHGNKAAPAVVAVIQPGTGWGGNWTDFEDPTKIFARSVLKNPMGVPGLLLYGGWGRPQWYQNPCWPDYRTHVRTLTPTLRLWRRSVGSLRSDGALVGRPTTASRDYPA